MLEAIFKVCRLETPRFDIFNVATDDYITVRDIADMAVDVSGLVSGTVQYEFTGGDRGWKGDVPIVQFDVSKIRSVGWCPTRTSVEAMRDSMIAMRKEIENS